MLAVEWNQAPPEWLRPVEHALAAAALKCRPPPGLGGGGSTGSTAVPFVLRVELVPASAAYPRALPLPSERSRAEGSEGLETISEVRVGAPSKANSIGAGVSLFLSPDAGPKAVGLRPLLDTWLVRWLQREGLYMWVLLLLCMSELGLAFFFPGGRANRDLDDNPGRGEVWVMCGLACMAWFLLAHQVSVRLLVMVATSFDCLALVASVLLASAAGLSASLSGPNVGTSGVAEVVFVLLVHGPLAVFAGTVDSLRMERTRKAAALCALLAYWVYLFARACADSGTWFDKEDGCFLVEPNETRNVYLVLVACVAVLLARLLVGILRGQDFVMLHLRVAAPEAQAFGLTFSGRHHDRNSGPHEMDKYGIGPRLQLEDSTMAMAHTLSHDIMYSLRARTDAGNSPNGQMGPAGSMRKRPTGNGNGPVDWIFDRSSAGSVSPNNFQRGHLLPGAGELSLSESHLPGPADRGTDDSSASISVVDDDHVSQMIQSLLRNSLLNKTGEVTKLVVITDLGQDNDDEMALMLMSELARSGEVEPLAVVANLRPSASRAALARGTLDMLGLHHVPVGIGSDGGSEKHADTFSEYISEGKTGVDYLSGPLKAVERITAAKTVEEAQAISKECRIYDGQWLLCDVLGKAMDRSVTLVLLSSMKDAAQLLREREPLFSAKVKCVTIMGGIDAAAARVWSPSTTRMLLPDEMAHNNCFDLPAAKFLYSRCQELGVPLVVLSRFAAYGCPVRRHVYDLMVRCQVPNPVICRLHQAQRASIERLWGDVCKGNKLPARCDRRWFCDTFCAGEGKDRGPNDSMWDIVRTFNMYDPLALLAAMPREREAFFSHEEFLGPLGTVHMVIGMDTDHNGISRAQELHDFLISIWMRAAGRPREGKTSFTSETKRPRELDTEGLTAALDPMKVHKEEELLIIRQKVLWLLDEQWPKIKNSSLLSTWKKRDSLISEIGPPMMLLHWETVKNLGRIPHWTEGHAITMAQAFKIAKQHNKRFFIEMFSHRWCNKFAPDDRSNTKAAALVEWAKYRWSTGLGTFFWVDYTCVDQNDIDPGVSMLPLYVSSCNNIICYDTPEYEPRAWCRVERLLFAAFVAPNTEFLSPEFVFDESAERQGSELKPQVEEYAVLPDPDEGELSWKRDRALIKEIKNLCVSHWGKCWKEGLMDSCIKHGNKTVTGLVFGETQVRLRRFTGPARAAARGSMVTL